MSTEDPAMTSHEYDGIQELDNQLPRWWVWLFYITIVFGVVYFIFYHVLGKGELPPEKYANAVAAYEDQAAEMAASAPAPEAAADEGPSNDPDVLAMGQTVYTTHCLACHTPTGGGLVGPNLTDDHWLHGASYADTVNTVIHGVVEKGMISWAPILKPEEIQAVCSYLYTLRGSNPAGAKAPEGTQVPGSDSPDYQPENS